MRASFAKWGNSLAIRIPMTAAREIGVSDGDPADLRVVDGKLVVEPLGAPVYDLAALLSSITPENLHAEVDPGRAVGNEFA